VIVSYSEWNKDTTTNLLLFRPRSVFLFLRALNNWCVLHEQWIDDMESNSNCLIIQYSELKDEFDLTMEAIFKFLQLEVDSEFIKTLRRDFYSINSEVYKKENKKRGYAFFRRGDIGGWREKFSWYHKLAVDIYFSRRIGKILGMSNIFSKTRNI